MKKTNSYNAMSKKKKIFFEGAHHSSCLVVLAVHGRARVRAVLPRVGKLTGHAAAELHVLAAATPLPPLAGGALVARVTTADGG